MIIKSPALAASWRRISKQNRHLPPVRSIKFAIFSAAITSSALAASAGNNLTLSAGLARQSDAQGRHVRESGLLSSRSTTERDSLEQTTAQATLLGGRTVLLQAGQDIAVQGSSVIGDGAGGAGGEAGGATTTLLAGRDVLLSAQETQTQSSQFSQTRKSGLMSSGLSVTLGKQDLSTDQLTTTRGAAGATVGAIAGDVLVVAGRTYAQSGSDLLAPAGSIDVAAQDIRITEARTREQTDTEQKFKQSGLTVAITAPVVSALQGMARTTQALSHTSDTRTQALGAATLALQGGQALGSLSALQGAPNPAQAASIGISISVGASQSSNTRQTTQNNARGSSLSAAGSVSLSASGNEGNDSGNLLIQGSSVRAGDTVNLAANNRIELRAATQTTQESSRQSSQSGSVGVGISFGAQTSVGVTVAASVGKGAGSGEDVSHANTRIEAGQGVAIQSGGDTTLAGAVVAARTVQAAVGGDLRIQSLQDTSTYTERSKTTGGSVTFGPAPGASLGLGNTRIDSNFASVTEQSGLRAGDGGFEVNVLGTTDLIGGAITSSEAAVQAGSNRFASAGQSAGEALQSGALTLSDINNTASFKASSVGVSVGAGGNKPSGSAGIGSDKGSASTTTQAAISGLAGPSTGSGQAGAARTGDAQAAIAPIFDPNKVRDEVSAQVQITQAFGQAASQAVGDYAEKQLKEAQKADDPAGIDAWKEGGTRRVALHALVGGLTGGVAGALGSGAASAAAPVIDQLQGQLKTALKDAGLGEATAQAIASLSAGATATTIGAAASGGSAAGAATAFNADMNNRQLHPSEKARIQDLAKSKAQDVCRGDASCEKQANLYWTDMLERVAEGRVDTQEAVKNQAYYQQIVNAAGKPGSEASMGAAENFFNALGEAQKMLNADAGKPIIDNRGNPILGTDGKPQTYFSATQAQRENPYGNIFPGGSPGAQASVIPGKENRDQDRLAYLNTPNGQAIPDTTIEEALIGVRVPSTGVGAVVQVTERNAAAALVGTAKAAEEALLRSGGALDKVGNPLLDMSALSNNQKGVIGDLFGSNTVKQIVPDGQKIARMQGVGTNGIDDLYKVNRADVDYVAIEYKFVGTDSKTGAQVLKDTNDGLQGSQSWIGGSGRIEKAVGDRALAGEVADSVKAGRFESWVVTTRPDGSTEIQVLDALGKPKPIDKSKIILPKTNMSGAQS